MKMQEKDLTRISRIFITEECVQPIPGSVEIEGKVLKFKLDAASPEGASCIDALTRYHLNIDRDPKSSEARRKMVDGMCEVEIDLADPEKLWLHPESVRPSEIKKL